LKPPWHPPRPHSENIVRQWLLSAFGLENVRQREVPEPTPSRGQIRVEVRAVSLNYRDLLVIRGQYNPKMPFPRILCSDAAGVVASVGEGVRSVRPGTRVAVLFMPGWQSGPITPEAGNTALGGAVDGVMTQSILLPPEAVVPIPDSMSFEQAATLPCAALTAWNALSGASLPEGATVLTMGTGGVSLFVLQFARAMGLRTLLVTGNPEKLQRPGVPQPDEFYDTRVSPGWDKWVRRMTSDRGADLVVELGGSGTMDRSLRSARIAGTVAAIGVLAAGGTFDPLPIVVKSLTVRGIYVGSKAMFVDMLAFMAQHRIEPTIDRVFEWADVPAAIKYMESAAHSGKIVVRVA